MTSADGSDRLEDAELLERCRAGQDEAWDVLVDRYQRLIYSVAIRNGLSQNDAIDVTQITFTVLLESIDKVRRDESLAWWLMTVARRQSWRIRDRGRRELLYDEVPERVEDPQLDWEQVASVHEALQRLGNPCRDLVTALYFEPASPTYAQIAKRFGRSIGGIGPLRGRCLLRLRAILQEAGWA